MNGQPVEQEKNPVIRIATSKGDILVELFEDEVPNTVANIISLAEADFYKGMSFHRIINGFMAQAGCPNSKRGASGMPGTGGPGYRADGSPKQSTPNAAFSRWPTAPVQWQPVFICFPHPHLDGRHAVFGQVTQGMEIRQAEPLAHSLANQWKMSA